MFGNLGSSGTGALSDTSTKIVPVATQAGDYTAIAQGFRTGTSADFLTLQSVVLGLFAEPGVSPRTVSIHAGAGELPGDPIAVSSPVSVGAQGRYTFSFADVALSANTIYWVIPQADVSWYLDVGMTNPTGQNSSGYAYMDTFAKTFESAPDWIIPGETSYSVSINAVPEPSTYALAISALGMLGLVAARRRRVGC